MNLSLTPRLEAFVRSQVESGLYNNASEVVREALRLLLERQSRAAPGAGAAPDKATIHNRLLDLEPSLRQRGITSVALFGSVLTGHARPDSDIDLLVDIDPQARVSLVDLAAIKALLEQHLDHDVDLVPREGLDPAIRRHVAAAERVF